MLSSSSNFFEIFLLHTKLSVPPTVSFVTVLVLPFSFIFIWSHISCLISSLYPPQVKNRVLYMTTQSPQIVFYCCFNFWIRSVLECTTAESTLFYSYTKWPVCKKTLIANPTRHIVFFFHWLWEHVYSMLQQCSTQAGYNLLCLLILHLGWIHPCRLLPLTNQVELMQ